MKIRSIRHRGLKTLIEHDDARGIRPDQIKRIRNILAAVIYASNLDAVAGGSIG